jgi:hypothetical protein
MDEKAVEPRHPDRAGSLDGIQGLEAIGALNMPLTRDFKETVKTRAQKDGAFREALLSEALDCFLAGNTDAGKAMLRDYINATIGFEALGRLTGKDAKSLMRMLGPKGNPQARNLFEVIAHLQEREGVHFHVHPAREKMARG